MLLHIFKVQQGASPIIAISIPAWINAQYKPELWEIVPFKRDRLGESEEKGLKSHFPSTSQKVQLVCP